MAVEKRAWRRRSSSPAGAAAGGGMRGAEGKLQGRARPAAPAGQGYFTAWLVLLFLCLTGLLVFLPLILPPPLPPPPPLLLMVVPVGLMAVLLVLVLALALVPSYGRVTSGVASSCLY